MRNIKKSLFLLLLLIISVFMTSCFGTNDKNTPPSDDSSLAYVDYNGGVPSFSIPDKIKAYEDYSELDGLGRCGRAEACLGRELMPGDDEERDSLSGVTPSGWKQAKYPGVVDGDYLYNRCHLIGFQLAGEQANKLNLITGTRYMNIEGMLPFENMVADYIKETGNHVMYRVTPVYADRYDLLASGVIMEGLSVEDGGDGISFCIYAYNKQPGVVINYRDGSSYLSGENPPTDAEEEEAAPDIVVINTSSKKFHLPTCSGATSMSEKNREEREYSEETLNALLQEGYTPCGTCKPMKDAA